MERPRPDLIQSEPDPYRLVTVRTASRLRGVTPKRLRVEIRTGALPAYQVGSWLFLRLKDVDEWLERMRYEPTNVTRRVSSRT